MFRIGPSTRAGLYAVICLVTAAAAGGLLHAHDPGDDAELRRFKTVSRRILRTQLSEQLLIATLRNLISYPIGSSILQR